MNTSYFLLLLHAHMPYVLDPGAEDTLEQRWLYEALIDCYIRLIQVFDRLVRDGVPLGITLSLSPTLLAQLENPLLIERLRSYLRCQIDLAGKEIKRTTKIPALSSLAGMYRSYYRSALETFDERCNGDLIHVFKSYQDEGILEIITCAATHAYLPLLRPTASGIRAQIAVAVKEYRRLFGISPAGLWLPECGYFPGLDRILLRAGIEYTFLDTHTVCDSAPPPEYGTYAPVLSPSGMVAFGRDVHSAKEVWSSLDGYPGDYDYRDFYRDIGYDLDLDYLRPYLPGGVRCHTGMKYHRIEQRGGEHQIYDPDSAARKVSIHADDFLAHRMRHARDLVLSMPFPPVVCAFYDAELFGHWWFEGPLWVEALFRKLSECREFFSPVTPGTFLSLGFPLQHAQPPGGSWGWKGHHEVWLNERNGWVYPHLFKAGEKMEDMARQDLRSDLEERALNQAGRELLLAQSSDWTFILHNQTLTEYATRRIKEHIGRFWRLIHQIEDNAIDEEGLLRIERQDNVFPTFSYKDFLPDTARGPDSS